MPETRPPQIPDQPPQGLDRRVAGIFAGILLVLLANTLVSRVATRDLREAQEVVSHTWEVHARLRGFEATLERLHNQGRGFILTNDTAFLDAFDDGLSDARRQLDAISEATADNPAQQERTRALRPLVERRLAHLRDGVERRRRDGARWRLDKQAAERAKVEMQQIRETLDAMLHQEDVLLGDRQAKASISEIRSQTTFFVATAVSIAFWTVTLTLTLRLLSERVRFEREMLDANARLEERIADRTRVLEEANRELEAFSYSVSHDLRAPLRHISGFAQLLQQKSAGALDENGQRYVAILLESARHAGNLVDDLLAFSRMGRVEMRSTEVAMDTLVQKARDVLAPDAEGRTVQWEIGTLPTVRGDPEMLALVWQNLLGNALKYTQPRDPARIEVGATRDANGWTFFVRDNGVGFDMAYADKLFGVFQRLHTRDEFPGTGIGLANVRRIIQRHGGRTGAEGAVDHGATFTFTLPDGKGDAT